MNKPPPCKAPNIRIPIIIPIKGRGFIIIPIKGRGFINQGSTLGLQLGPTTFLRQDPCCLEALLQKGLAPATRRAVLEFIMRGLLIEGTVCMGNTYSEKSGYRGYGLYRVL